MLDVDATLVTAHSEKEQAAATFKRGFGFHPIGGVVRQHRPSCWPRRCGRATPAVNHAGDHIDVLSRAIAQVPSSYRRQAAGPRRRGRRHPRAAGLADRPKARSAAAGWSTRSASRTKNTALTSAITTVPERCLDAGGHRRRRGPRRRRRRRGHRPAGSAALAGRDAGHRPPGTAASRRPAVAVRGGRRLALPSLRHQHRRRAARRSWRPGTAPTPGSRTGSRPPKTPAWAGSPPASTPSTRPGCRSSQSPPT